MKQTSFTAISILIALAAAFFSFFTVNAKTVKSNAPQVIMTGEIAKKVIGYQGPTPVSISISNGRITNITALDNKETPAYFNKAKQKVFNQFVGSIPESAWKILFIVMGTLHLFAAIILTKMVRKETPSEE